MSSLWCKVHFLFNIKFQWWPENWDQELNFSRWTFCWDQDGQLYCFMFENCNTFLHALISQTKWLSIYYFSAIKFVSILNYNLLFEFDLKIHFAILHFSEIHITFLFCFKALIFKEKEKWSTFLHICNVMSPSRRWFEN